MAPDPYRYFRPEARDLVDRCIKGVLELEQSSDRPRLVAELLRLAHTLKGAARVVQQSEIAQAAHAIEDTLAPLRNDGASVTAAQIGDLLDHCDTIAQCIARLAPPDEAPRAEERAKPQPPRIARADMGEADAVLDGVAHAHALLGRVRAAAADVGPVRRIAEALLLRELSAGRARDAGIDANDMARDMQRKLTRLERRLNTRIDRLGRELVDMGQAAQRLRMASAESLFASLAMTAHEVARDQGKQVTFESSGGDIRIDLHVLEILAAALIQIVRNAVAHGIEAPADRSARGKPPAGRICVAVSLHAGVVEFACSDDGAGVDYAAVRRAAWDGGAGLQDDREVARLLLGGGVSTAGAVTQSSGRGVGLDVARESIERLGGEIMFETKRGEGTTFRLRAPAALSSLEALAVMVGDNIMGIPLIAVRAAARLSQRDIFIDAGHAAFRHEDRVVPFAPLATLLFDAPWIAGRMWTAIVVETPVGPMGLGVDRLLGVKSVVVRSLPLEAGASPAVGGASLDLDGNPELVLDLDGLAAVIAQRQLAPQAPSAKPSRPVLVIDDSMTTRMLEKSILEAAGYEVDLAESAEEGLERLLQKRFGLILVDVEMPGMNGFDFIGRLRSGAVQPDVPAVLLTSRTSEDDFQRGREVGASAHLAKGAFDQAGLLSTVAQLMVC